MIIGRSRFNINLLLLLAALFVVSGCRTNKDDRESRITNLRIHIEVFSDTTAFSRSVPIYRQKPVEVTVDKSPFLTEAQVVEARVVEVRDGFDLQIKFNRKGRWLLESYTTANTGRHLAIFCEFGESKFRQARWLAAPLIQNRNSKGVLTFAPDADRAETDEIVLGLQNAARKYEEDAKW